MKKVALIRANKVENILVLNDDFDLSILSADQVVIVTNRPEAKIGQNYDSATDTFEVKQIAIDIVAEKILSKAKIDDMAAKTRSKFLTLSAGQEATYLLKEQQARAFKTAGYPADTVPILVQGYATTYSITPQQATDTIIARADECIVLTGAVEDIRLGAKLNIDNATTVDELKSIEDITKTRLNAIQ